ncbi:hypothetical protein [Akkermansia glycaniphila]|nr:hypothetical protein [Akkermansia glycaniphila]
MATKLEVVNMALCRMGEGCLSAQDLADLSKKEAAVAAAFYGQAVASVMQRYTWAFALKGELMPVEETEDGKAAIFLPDDFLRMDSVGVLATWLVRGREVVFAECPRVEEVFVSYVSSDVAEEEWPALFTDCVVLSLASYLAGNLAANYELAAQLTATLDQVALPAAISYDAKTTSSDRRNQSVAERFRGSALLKSRLGW